MANPDFSLIRKKNPCPCVDSSWTQTGLTRCSGNNTEAQEESNCGSKRWTVTGTVTWTPTGETRCQAFVTQAQEVNDCGATRWVDTSATCGYCPSMRLSCDGSEVGFGFHEMDPKDPAATVELAPCQGDTSADPIYIYPTAGPGHTLKKLDCDGNVLGYAVNRSDCAPDCGCASPEINVTVNPVNNFAPTTNVAAPNVAVTPINNFAPTTNVAAPNVTLPAPNVVAASFDQDGELTITRSDATTVTAQIPTC